jgi:imidazolonepropionase-like amidohydrolase
MPNAVVFFDLWGTLLRIGDRGVELLLGVEELLRAHGACRLGILCNAGAGRSARDVRRALEAVGLEARFQRELIVTASDLPTPLPDRRAFAVAAALAEVPIGTCVFVSRDGRMRLSALAAGMTALAADAVRTPVDSPAGLAAGEPGAVVAGPALLAGEVDEDTGPTFILEGRVVTMDQPAGVIDDGRIIVSKGKIVSVHRAADPLPAEFAAAKRVNTKGTIYPGLIDLHNHFAYNVLPLWVVPRRSDGTPYRSRTEWPKHKEYKPNVTEPLSLMAGFSPTAEAIVRYVEAKGLIAGTTTGQGIRGKSGVKTVPRMYHGAMRNVEETNDIRLPEARTMVPDLQAGKAEKVEDFRRALVELGEQGAAYFYHLAEGLPDKVRQRYLDLADNNLVQPSLVGIHALGLKPSDLDALAKKKAKVVWSPYSNLLLYGQTVDVAALKESGALFSIGCDWTPTGSKNLLQELKVARHVVDVSGAGLRSEDLVRAVTINAARVVGWDRCLGCLRPGAFADLVVIAGNNGDAYDRLIDATEASVALVVVHGVPRYGDAKLFEQLHADPIHPAEALKIGGERKLLHTFTAGSQINNVSLSEAKARLEEAMGDLPAFRDRVEAAGAQLLAMGAEDEGFTLVLDNEFDEGADSATTSDAAASLLAGTPVVLPDKIELDGLEVNAETYWPRVLAQKNVSDQLKEALKDAYQ